MRKRLPRWVRIGLVIILIPLLLIGVNYVRMVRNDAEHAAFFETGKTINTFLKAYAKASSHAKEPEGLVELSQFYADTYHAEGRGDWQYDEGRLVGGVNTYYLKAEGIRDFSKNDVLTERAAYFEPIGSIDGVAYKIHLVESLKPDMAVLSVKHVFDGHDAGQKPFQDRAFFRWTLVPVPNDEHDLGWRIVRDELIEGVRVARSETVFADAEIDWGFKHMRDPKLDIKQYGPKMKFGLVEHAMSGVSAVDYDKDGRPDLFFPDGVHSRLLRNTTERGGAVAFEDVTSAAGLDGLDQACEGLFADFDNDGDEDLFVTRYLAENLFYQNQGDGTFREIGASMGLNLSDTSVSAALLDYDRDGYLDIYIGLYGNGFEEFPRLPFYATNGRKNVLYHNLQGKGFEDVSAQSGTADSGWALAVTSGDFNDDGWPDLGVANDFGHKCLLRNNKDGTFTDVARESGTLDFSGGMGLLFADLDNDRHTDLYTSNIKSNQRWFGEDQTVVQYMNNVMRTKWAWVDMGEYRKLYSLVGSHWPKLGQDIGEGNSLFYNNGDASFRELKESHTNQAGWGWSVAALDFDNDTDLDLYAANGWITNTPGTDL